MTRWEHESRARWPGSARWKARRCLGSSRGQGLRDVFRRRFGVVLAASLAAICPRGDANANHHELSRRPAVPRIARAVEALLKSGNVVAPVDVLIGMGLLTREQLEDWRRGRMPYLEQIINCNLARLGRLLRILRFHAHDLNLKPSWTAYMRWGKGPKQRLRFSKSGEPKVEEAYATHFVWPGKGAFHPPAPVELPQ